MFKKIKHTILLCSAAFLPFLSSGYEAHALELTAEQEKICNPKPMKDDLVIPGPNGSCFTFRPVHVVGNNPAKGTVFYVGDGESDNFRTRPTKVMIGGVFPNKTDDNLWTYYMGKYETTQGQYYAVMNAMPKNYKGQKPKPTEINLPITNLNYFEAIQFMDTLNQWIFENALTSLPMSGSYPAFIRLPSEIEWEFAARGGIAVEPSLFESPNPYDDEFSKYEWFSGPRSSHGKVKAVGLLNSNPLGLHDMLGNVQEMTSSPYRIRYYQGGSGGFVGRGSSFTTNESNLGSARRLEEPYYLMRNGKPVPNAKITLGLRLALAAPLLTGKEATEIFELDHEKDPLNANDKDSSTMTPADFANAPTSDQEEVTVAEMLSLLDKLNKTPQSQLAQSLGREIYNIRNLLLDSLERRQDADADAALSSVRQGHFFGQEIYKVLNTRRNIAQVVLKKEGKDDYSTWKDRLDDLDYNLNSFFERYRETIVALNKLSQDVVKTAFTRRRDEDKRKLEQQTISQELATHSFIIMDLVIDHYEQFNKTKRADIKLWREQYNNLLKTSE